MFETAFALGLTQFARSLSLPERVRHRTARNAALEPWRLRNTGVDALYYDVKALTADETFYISDSIASEGLIMIVPPTGGPMLTLCDSVDEYRLRGGRDVHALAVAGMGGSAIGAAAFARNIANAIGEPVAAVVSGYGLGDIVNEAIGGAFLFGWLGNVRSNLEVIDDMVGRPKLGAYGKRDAEVDGEKSRGLDADTVASLLSDPTLSFTLISGHSRGNRVIADALNAFLETHWGDVFEDAINWMDFELLLTQWASFRPDILGGPIKGELTEADYKHEKVGVFWGLLFLTSQSKVELLQENFYQDLKVRQLNEVTLAEAPAYVLPD